jgi:acetyl esterase/lipase
MKARLQDPGLVSPVFQLLMDPVIDNTATTSTAWASSQHSPGLTPGRMLWYRAQYFRAASNPLHWDASPNLAPRDVLATSPATWVAVAECDLLAPEQQKYAQLLRDAGVASQDKVYAGAMHWSLVLAGYRQPCARPAVSMHRKLTCILLPV